MTKQNVVMVLSIIFAIIGTCLLVSMFIKEPIDVSDVQSVVSENEIEEEFEPFVPYEEFISRKHPFNRLHWTHFKYREHIKVERVEVEDNSDKIQIPIYDDKQEIDVLYVKIYNEYGDDYNKTDGYLFIEDVAKALYKHHINGLWISAALAQAYTEGGAGKSGVYIKSNNLFGIKAGTWDGYVYARSNGKVYLNRQYARLDGATDLFRAYVTMEESVIDYIKLIQVSSGYSHALSAQSPSEYLGILVKYNYGNSYMLSTWKSVMKIYNLYQYDKETDKMYLCLGCYELFEEPKKYVEKHGLDSPPYEEWYACPHCASNYVETFPCDCCGEYITWEYIKYDDKTICADCYEVRNIEYE